MLITLFLIQVCAKSSKSCHIRLLITFPHTISVCQSIAETILLWRKWLNDNGLWCGVNLSTMCFLFWIFV